MGVTSFCLVETKERKRRSYHTYHTTLPPFDSLSAHPRRHRVDATAAAVAAATISVTNPARCRRGRGDDFGISTTAAGLKAWPQPSKWVLADGAWFSDWIGVRVSDWNGTRRNNKKKKSTQNQRGAMMAAAATVPQRKTTSKSLTRTPAPFLAQIPAAMTRHLLSPSQSSPPPSYPSNLTG